MATVNSLMYLLLSTGLNTTPSPSETTEVNRLSERSEFSTEQPVSDESVKSFDRWGGRSSRVPYRYTEEDYKFLGPTTKSPFNSLSREPSCPENEEFSRCKAHCQLTCYTYDKPNKCFNVCIFGCVCKPGLVRGPDEKCIKVEECPSTHSLPDIQGGSSLFNLPKVCGKNETFSMCSSQCDKHCHNFDDDSKVCPSLVRMCKPGCTCEEGFVRGPKRECVRPFDCPNQRNFCPEGEVFSPSHAHCEADCVRGEDTKKDCDKSLAVPGCTCKEGLVRAPDGRCIHNRKCPPTKICPPNEKFVNCSALCQKSCTNLEVPRDCQKPCVGGCVCEDGFVRGKHGRCIRPKWCPPEEDNEDSEATIIPPPYTDYPYRPESITETPTVLRREDSEAIIIYPPYTDNPYHPESLTENPTDFWNEDPEATIIPPAYTDYPYRPESITETPTVLRREDSEAIIIYPPYTDNPYHPESLTENPTDFWNEDPEEDFNDVSDTAGCPSNEECTFSCRDYGHRYGHCIGEKNQICSCYVESDT